MLSPRLWLERFPLQFRLFVTLLALLSFVAPTWHVCSMGGHAMQMASSHQAMQHEVMNSQSSFARSASGALICFCAPKHRNEKFPIQSKFVLNGHISHDDSCLALLLSAMPALAVSSFITPSVANLSFPLWFPARREFPARELIRTFSGRGPPR